MLNPNFGDIGLWFGLSLAYFHAMDSAVRPSRHSNQIIFAYSSWWGSSLKAAIVVLPLPVSMFAPQVFGTAVWEALAVASIACLSAPMAFPHLRVELETLSLSDKFARWLASRVDFSLKKGLVLLVLSLALRYVPTDWIGRAIPVPEYFANRALGALGPFTAALLVVAFVSVLLRAMVVVALSMLLSAFLLPISLMLVGYAIDLGLSLSASASLSLTVLTVVLIDLGAYLLAAWHSDT